MMNEFMMNEFMMNEFKRFVVLLKDTGLHISAINLCKIIYYVRVFQ